MMLPTSIDGEVRNNGDYDPVPYKFWSYPETARNFYENHVSCRGFPPTSSIHSIDPRNRSRKILPRYLCFLDQISDKNLYGKMTPHGWMKLHNQKPQPSYIFVSYTGPNQFPRPCGSADIEKIRKQGQVHNQGACK